MFLFYLFLLFPCLRLVEAAAAPLTPCDVATSCNNHGKCAPVFAGDLCICDMFWEGNDCNTPIETVPMRWDGGMSSGDLAAAVLLPLIGIPVGTGALMRYLSKNDCFDD